MAESGSVLVVDDDPILGELLLKVLVRAGFQADLAHDGKEAIACFTARAYDAALIDIFMPGKDGIETIVEVRSRWPGCKLVAMSGGGRLKAPRSVDAAPTAAPDAELTKPFAISEMIAAVRQVLSR